MAFTSFSATPTLSEWNDFFSDLADILDGETENLDWAFAVPVTTLDASGLTSDVDVTFRCPMPCRLGAISLDAYPSGATTATVSLATADANQAFLLAQGDGFSDAFSGSGQGHEYATTNLTLQRGVRYRLKVSVASGNLTFAGGQVTVNFHGVGV